MAQRLKKRNSTAKSFYIDNRTIKRLAEQSKQENVSINSLVNRILKEHVELRYPAEQYSSIVLTRDLVSKLLEENEELFISFAKEHGGSIFRTTMLQQMSQKNLVTYKTIVKGFCDYGRVAGYNESVVGGKLVITLSHDLGEKWSKVLREYFYAGLKEIIEEDYPAQDVFTIVDTGLIIMLPASIIE